MLEDKSIQLRIDEIRFLQTDQIYHFQYSKIAKIPFKVHSFIEIMNCRMIDFSEAADSLMKNNHVIPSLSLIRSIIENAAITFRIEVAIETSLKSNQLFEGFDLLITRLTFGAGYDEIKAINVLNHLDILDKKYEGIRKTYDLLCEFVHPNADGVQSSYSILNEDIRNTDILKVFSPKHPFYKEVENCFQISMEIYLECSKKIRTDLPAFALLCERQILKK